LHVKSGHIQYVFVEIYRYEKMRNLYPNSSCYSTSNIN